MKTIQEKFTEAINNFREEITQMVLKVFNDNNKQLGEPLVFALILKDKKVDLALLAGLGPLFASNEGKDKAAEIIKSFGKSIKPIAIGFASEGYASTYPLEDHNVDRVVNAHMQRHPEKIKKEILFITVETHDKECSTFLEIERKGDNVNLSPLHSMDWTSKDESNSKGRFVGLLEDNYSEFAKIIQDQLSTSLN